MSTTKDNHEGKHNQGTLVPKPGASYDDEFIEKVSRRAAEIVIDADPFRPIDMEHLAIRIAQILRNQENQELGERIYREANWAVWFSFRTLIRTIVVALIGGFGVVIAKIKGWL